MSFKLKELLDEKGYIRGPFGSTLRRNELLDEGIPVYEQQNAIYNNREFRYFINNEKYEEMKRFTVRENDLIISCSGTVGRVSVIRKDDPIGIISQALLILRPNTEKVLTDFLFYFFISRIGYNSIISRSGGSVQANISKRAVIENIDIDVPPLPEQKAIAHILSTLDEKIEVNNQINKTLENMAQTIFKQWFVDFEFPNEDGEPYKSSGGEMVESELGMIPKGWEVGTVGELAEIVSKGTTPRKSDIDKSNDDNMVKFLKVKDIGYDGIIDMNSVEYIPKDVHLNQLKRSILEYKDILISIAGTIGRVSYVNYELTNANTNQAVAFIRLKDIEKYFLFLLYKFKSNEFQESLVSKVVQGVQANISLTVIKNEKLLIPKNYVLQRYNIFMNSIFNGKDIIVRENINLRMIRDTLLPKLMSGEIRVPFENDSQN